MSRKVLDMREHNEPRLFTEFVEKHLAILQEGVDPTPFVGSSSEAQAVREKIRFMAGNDVSLVITGGTGIGKTHIARLIHEESDRRKDRFVRLNLSAFPDTLVESELFGTVKGAFTGATDKKGALEVASKGTLFLDEFTEISGDIQQKLLHVLESDQTFFRLGDTKKEIRTTARVIVATNRDLEDALRTGVLREDLYWRVHQFRIDIPPLKRRRADISELVASVVAQFQFKYTKRVYVTKEAISKLSAHEWRGNVRELTSVVQIACMIANERDQILNESDIHFAPLYSSSGSDSPILTEFFDEALVVNAVRKALAKELRRELLEE